MKSNDLTPQLSLSGVPAHVAFIMDGNGRWASRRGMMRKFGHREGVKTLDSTAKYAFDLGIDVVTVYAFSTENRFRPQSEVDELIKLIRQYFKKQFRSYIARGIRIRCLGDKSYFPEDVVNIIETLENDSCDLKNGTLQIALNYGGRDEIVRAAAACAKLGEVTAAGIEANLYTAGVPDPDLIVRTGGEMRLSNFMLYQAAYAELFFTDTLWPDFSKTEFDKILSKFATRTRKFGKIDGQ